ncbi:MAG: P-II family nitrogen regulator [Desulfitobacteriaceae bacterium]
MKKIEAIIRPGKLEDIQNELERQGVSGLTVSQVLGFGRQKGHSEFYRGNEVQVRLLPKVKVEVIVKDEHLEKVISIFVETTRTGQVGDGKIFVSNVEKAVRIRTGEINEEAL